ncbi:glycosyltransferase [Lyngbya aestuarii]|uniref:glycosyltransferase n=1 Tax=Lyngbya aestuarii TaxID=118322 RepID=UPI00403DBB97
MIKFSIITPCFNAEKYIEETVRSVIEQTAILSKKAELEYIICDGNSTDKTVDIIDSIKQEYKCDYLKIISEPDAGMYDALSKGLKMASGDIIAYINAGDYYNKHAFDVVLEIFESGKASWLTGYSVFYNEKSQIVEVTLPFKYRKELFACGYYGKELPTVQQESTFWSSSLNSLIDFEHLSKFKYAGDFYLWLQFSKICDLKIVKSYLGGFKFHRGQLSGTGNNAYYEEKRSMLLKPKLHEFALAIFDKIMWSAPFKVKTIFNKGSILRYDVELQEWI